MKEIVVANLPIACTLHPVTWVCHGLPWKTQKMPFLPLYRGSVLGCGCFPLRGFPNDLIQYNGRIQSPTGWGTSCCYCLIGLQQREKWQKIAWPTYFRNLSFVRHVATNIPCSLGGGDHTGDVFVAIIGSISSRWRMLRTVEICVIIACQMSIWLYNVRSAFAIKLLHCWVTLVSGELPRHCSCIVKLLMDSVKHCLWIASS